MLLRSADDELLRKVLLGEWLAHRHYFPRFCVICGFSPRRYGRRQATGCERRPTVAISRRRSDIAERLCAKGCGENTIDQQQLPASRVAISVSAYNASCICAVIISPLHHALGDINIYQWQRERSCLNDVKLIVRRATNTAPVCKHSCGAFKIGTDKKAAELARAGSDHRT